MNKQVLKPNRDKRITPCCIDVGLGLSWTWDSYPACKSKTKLVYLSFILQVVLALVVEYGSMIFFFSLYLSYLTIKEIYLVRPLMTNSNWQLKFKKKDPFPFQQFRRSTQVVEVVQWHNSQQRLLIILVNKCVQLSFPGVRIWKLVTSFVFYYIWG